MYQVIKMFGDWEPWWFLDDWQDDIIEEQTFEYFEEAVSFYKSEWQSLRMNLPICKCHDNFQAAPDLKIANLNLNHGSFPWFFSFFEIFLRI